MKKYKNDITNNYIGTEPSPKGLGYCAHRARMNTRDNLLCY
jgi:hypothetical protein